MRKVRRDGPIASSRIPTRWDKNWRRAFWASFFGGFGALGYAVVVWRFGSGEIAPLVMSPIGAIGTGLLGFFFSPTALFGLSEEKKPNASDTPRDPTGVPQLAELMLLFLLPKHHRKSSLGDLEQEFREIAGKHGLVIARWWYWRQAVELVAKTLPLALALKAAAWLFRQLRG